MENGISQRKTAIDLFEEERLDCVPASVLLLQWPAQTTFSSQPAHFFVCPLLLVRILIRLTKVRLYSLSSLIIRSYIFNPINRQ